MGLFLSKPDFVMVLSDKQVKQGEEVVLRCESNTEGVEVSWEKGGSTLKSVEKKIYIDKRGTICELKIKNADDGDEGVYTIHLRNKQGQASCSAMVIVELNEWRTIPWTPDTAITALRAFKDRNSKVTDLNFLLYGPIGAGKSSTINTIKTIFEGRLFVNCLAASASSTDSKSHTVYYERFRIGNAQDGFLPFSFFDVRGLEMSDNEGVNADDIISAIKGHVKDGYMFNPGVPLTEGNQYYLKNPSLSDKIHCLVNILPADKISLIKEDFIKKMKPVREEASRLGLPQVIFMTRVDEICPLTKKDLCNIYKSKKIKDKMLECSVELGVPMNCIFPVQNYHEETDTEPRINSLMLHALTKIVHFADDFVVKCSDKQTSENSSK